MRRSLAVALLGVVTVGLAGCGGGNPPANLTSGVELTVYSGEGFGGIDYSDSKIARMRAYECDPNAVREVFGLAVHRDGTRIWKSSRFGIVRLADGTRKRIAISYYGGFFAVLGEPGYYEFTGDGPGVWDEMLRTALQAPTSTSCPSDTP